MPKVVPKEKTMDVVLELMTFREILTTRFSTDIATFMNVPFTSFSLTTFVGHRDGTISTKVTFNIVFNRTAYVNRLKFYSSSATEENLVPAAVFRRFDESVRGAATGVPGAEIQGAVLVKVEPVSVDTHDKLCFIGQDKCQVSYIVIVVIAVAVCGALFFAVRSVFKKWADEAPTRERQFNQEGNGAFASADNIPADTEMSLMQQYQRQEDTLLQHRRMQVRQQVDADL